MTPFQQSGNGPKGPGSTSRDEGSKPGKELVIVTGISGAGKASVLKAFEDLGYHAVDNLPLELLPDFADLVGKSAEIDNAAIVVDVREGQTLDRLPEILKGVRTVLPTSVIFLDAKDDVLVRRYSETRRPHPLSRSETVSRSIVEERQLLDPIRNVADTLIDTSNFNVHELRANIQACSSPASASGSKTACRWMPTWCSMCASFPILTSFPSSATRLARILRSLNSYVVSRRPRSSWRA